MVMLSERHGKNILYSQSGNASRMLTQQYMLNAAASIDFLFLGAMYKLFLLT